MYSSLCIGDNDDDYYFDADYEVRVRVGNVTDLTSQAECKHSFVKGEANLTCDGALVGSIVSVQMVDRYYSLILCDVQVFGHRGK